MTQKEILKKLNNQIDNLLIKGKEDTKEYERLCKMHRQIAKTY